MAADQCERLLVSHVSEALNEAIVLLTRSSGLSTCYVCGN
jgi:hypothetical protein